MNNVPIQVGVTGGLGAGKSLVCEIFAALGIPVYNADKRARWLMEENTELVELITSTFGEESFIRGKLNRDFLAKKVFNDPEQLSRLNNLVHPMVRLDSEDWASGYPDKPYLIREAALMIESGSYKDLDLLITVSAPATIRKARVLRRDPFRTDQEIDQIMASQATEEHRQKLADFIIVNDGDTLLIPQVLEIHNKLDV